MSGENQRSPISDKLRKAWRTVEMILAVLVIIAFGVAAGPLIWSTIAYWLGLEVPPINMN